MTGAASARATGTARGGMGLAVLASVWLWPLPWLDLPPFSAHMTMHMAVVAIASPLLALGVAGGPWDPVARWPGAFSPIVASMAELVAVWAWHAPALHHVARHTAAGLVAEQATFLATGLFLWLSALGGGRSARRRRAAGGLTGLLLTSMHMTLLGALLTLPGRPLYAHGEHGWLSATHDQQLGGAIMLLVGGGAYLVGALWLLAGSLGEEEA